MRYFKITDENANIIAFGKNDNIGAKLTEDEYNHLLAEIREKAALVDRLYSGEITIDNVPTEWQEEITRRVNERIEMQGTVEEQDISAEEALEIMLGGET